MSRIAARVEHAVRNTPHDAKLGAAADSGLPAHVIDIVVLSTDGGLLATLREVCGPQLAIWHAPSADTAVDYLVGGRCGILLADLDALRGDVAALFDRLHAQFPELVLIAGGRRGDEPSVANQLSSGRVHRFLHKPLSPARAAQFISAATRRYAELRNVEPPMLSTVKALAARRNWGALTAGAVALVGAALLLIVWRAGERSSVAVSASNSYAQVGANQLADALSHAQIAYLAGRLTEPKGDNALDYYSSVLALQPDHVEARAGVQRVLEALESRVVSALQTADAARGAIALARLQKAKPDHPRLDRFRAELLAVSRGTRSKAGETTRAALATTAEEFPSATRLTSNLQAARERIADERLIEPSDDNARLYLQRAQDAGENASTLTILATELGQRLLDKTEVAVTLSDDIQAQRWLEAANDLDRQFALSLSNLANVRVQVDELQIASRAEALAAQVAVASRFRERGELIEPPRDNAYEHMMSLRDSAAESDAFRNEQQRLVFALLESARTALIAGDLDRADALVARADALVPGMSTTQSLLEEIELARKGNEALTR